jgi:aryl-alcohol dehydrogenase-like predicted oxidoreductase
MNYRRFGRTNWQVSEIGFGAWGIGGGDWGAVDDATSVAALERAIALGVNFIDTAFDYGKGHSEGVVGGVVRTSGRRHGDELYVATKIPPKNELWPTSPGSALDDVFPNTHIREYVQISLQNLGLTHIDLMQFHVWDDAWAERDEWKQAIQDLTSEGLVRHWGISINDFQPANGIAALETGLISAVQVIYNVFEQAPESALYPTCHALDVGVIARVPLDEGALTGTLRPGHVFAADDWRASYFRDGRLDELDAKLHALQTTMDAFETTVGSLAEGALRFCLAHPAVGTVIPGMRTAARVEQNVAVSDGRPLSARDLEALRPFAWQKNWYA